MPNHDPTAHATRTFASQVDQQLDKLNDRIQEATARLDQLNANIQAASASSGRLARALNWLTAVAGGVAFLGVVVAALALWRHWGA